MSDTRLRWRSTLRRMSRREEHVRELAAQDAADWYQANRDGLDATQERQFQEWLRKSPVHIREYLAITAIGDGLRSFPAEQSVEELIAEARADEGPDDLDTVFVDRNRAPLARRPPSWLWAAAATVILGIAAALTWSSLDHESATVGTVAHFETRHGERSTRVLADNSVVLLDSDSAVSVRYGRASRDIELLRGRAYFEVFHDPARPFQVHAGQASIRDLGTKFDVRLQSPQREVTVTVAEGRVRVRPASLLDRLQAYAGGNTAGGAVELGAGERVRVLAGRLSQRETVDLATSTAWVRGRIILQATSLAEAVAAFNAYSAVPIQIDTPALATFRITGSFRTDDTESFLAFLRGLQGVHVQTTPDAIRVSRP